MKDSGDGQGSVEYRLGTFGAKAEGAQEGLRDLSKRVDDGFGRQNQRIDDLSKRVDDGFERQNQRIDDLSKRVDDGFERQDQRIDDLSNRVDDGFREAKEGDQKRPREAEPGGQLKRRLREAEARSIEERLQGEQQAPRRPFDTL